MKSLQGRLATSNATLSVLPLYSAGTRPAAFSSTATTTCPPEPAEVDAGLEDPAFVEPPPHPVSTIVPVMEVTRTAPGRERRRRARDPRAVFGLISVMSYVPYPLGMSAILLLVGR